MEVLIHPTARITGDVQIGKGSIVFPGAVINGEHGSVRIGENVAVEDNCLLMGGKAGSGKRSASRRGLEIGNNVIIGHSVVIEASKIGNQTLVGIKAVVNPHCEMGDFSIVGAGAVIEAATTIPSHCVMAGRPAQKISLDKNATNRWIKSPGTDRFPGLDTIIENLKGTGTFTVDRTAVIDPTAVLIGQVEVGAGTIIKSGVVIRGDLGKITIGRDSIIGENSVLHLGDPNDSARGIESRLDIGHRVRIGANVVVNGVLLEDEVLIEDDAFILHGVKIGKGAEVLARSGVMTGMEIPAGKIVSGLPGRIQN